MTAYLADMYHINEALTSSSVAEVPEKVMTYSSNDLLTLFMLMLKTFLCVLIKYNFELKGDNEVKVDFE